jgi:predicted Zn-dependent protease
MFKNQASKLFLLAALVLIITVGVIVALGDLTNGKSTNKCNQIQCDTTQCDSIKCDTTKQSNQ